MRVTLLRLRDFRCYETAEVGLGPGLTVVHGRNGAGKTNLLEALYLGCTGRSCRTSNERELVRFGAPAARVELTAEGADGVHEISVGLQLGEKRIKVDGAAVERLADSTSRPLAGVFLPDRLELVKGAPALRRGHLDQVVAALRPARAEARRAYGRALAQRNALLGRIRAGAASPSALDAWDAELARVGVELMANRAEAVERIAGPFAQRAGQLGLDGDPSVAYRPRSRAADAAGLAAELLERRDSDVERGFSAHGPHRDDVLLARAGHDLRSFGSQGQQRLALLALLLAERDAIADVRGEPPLMLLDDVMSELDAGRREMLVEVLERGGQSVITTTDLDHVPNARSASVARVAVSDGALLQEAAAA